MFLDDDIPEFTSSASMPHRPKPTPYQSTTSISERDRYAQNTPHQVTNGTPHYKPLSDQITEQISKNVYYSDHPTTYPTTAPSSPFFPHFSPTKQPQTATNPQPPPQPQAQQWQPEQLQQQLQQHNNINNNNSSSNQQQQQQAQNVQQMPIQQSQPQTQYTTPQQTQQMQQTQSQKFRYQVPENSEIFDKPTITTTPPVYQTTNHAVPQSRPLSPLTSSYAVGDTDSVYLNSKSSFSHSLID
jgi:hypothetical protein